MRARSHIAMLLAAVAGIGSILSPPAADAAMVRLTFTGTYDTYGRSVFGESGSAVPYSYELTYDTSLDTDPTHFATGAALGAGRHAAHDMYAYSASGVTASGFIFGTKAWDFPEDSFPYPIGSHPAPLWLDTDLSVSAPTVAYLSLRDADADLHIGDTVATLASVYLSGTRSTLILPGPGAGRPVSSDMLIASTIVPEPATFELGIVAAGGFLAFLWRRRRSR